MVSVPLYQSGTMTPRRVVRFDSNGLAQDAGGLTGDAGEGKGVLPFAITDANLGLAFRTDASSLAHTSLQLGFDGSGNGLIQLAAEGGAASKGLKVKINGTTYDWVPSATGNLTGPGTTVVGDLVAFNNTGGSLAKVAGTGLRVTNSAAAVSGLTAKIDNILEQNALGVATYLGANFSNPLYISTAFSNKLDSGMTGAGVGGSGYFGLLYAIHTNGYRASATGLGSWVQATTNADQVTGANFVAQAAAGVTPTQLCGMEIDMAASATSGLPAINTNVSPTIGLGLGLYAYNKQYANGFLVGTQGGTWKYGLAISAGAIDQYGIGIAFGAGASTMATGIDFGSASVIYTASAVHLYTNHKLSFDATGFGTSTMYADAAGNLRITVPAAGTTISFRNTTDAATVASITNAGNFAASGTVTVGSTSLLTSSQALFNGAAAATGTLTNAPAAGNPTKWIQIVDNGTNRYVPAW